MKHLIRFLAVAALVMGAAVGVVGSTSTATSVTPPARAGSSDDIIRWDVINLNPNVLITSPGGAATARDRASKDLLRVTGSGQFDVNNEKASGGGRFVHLRANGSRVGRGSYVVTDFVSFEPLAGSIEATPIIDGVAEKSNARAGILTVNVAVYVGRTVAGHATMEVHCTLPGSPAGTVEGVRVKVDGGPNFSKIVDHGPTIFHVLDE